MQCEIINSNINLTLLQMRSRRPYAHDIIADLQRAQVETGELRAGLQLRPSRHGVLGVSACNSIVSYWKMHTAEGDDVTRT